MEMIVIPNDNEDKDTPRVTVFLREFKEYCDEVRRDFERFKRETTPEQIAAEMKQMGKDVGLEAGKVPHPQVAIDMLNEIETFLNKGDVDEQSLRMSTLLTAIEMDFAVNPELLPHFLQSLGALVRQRGAKHALLNMPIGKMAQA